jgi:outer membrane protein, heavy metal efflux system
MTGRYFFPYALLLLMFVGGCSTYSQLDKDLEQYQPPLYATSPPPEGRAQPETSDEAGFALEKKKISEAKALWEKALQAPRRETSFFIPPSQLLNSLKPAARDAAAASGVLTPRFSLDTLETLAFLRNPGIKAAENRARAAIDTYSQVMALDDILREYSAFTEGMMTGVGPLKGKEPMKTKFPFPGILSLKGEIVGQEIKGTLEVLEIAKKEAVTQARKAYWNLIFFCKAEKIARETIGLYRHLEQVAAIRYETGGTSYQDVIKVRIRREILEEDLDTLLEKQQNVKSKILEILNLPPGTRIGMPEDRKPPGIVPPLKGLYKLTQQRRQELRRMRARVGKMERLIEMAETLILPPYTLNLSLYEDEAVTQVGTIAVRDDFPVSTRAYRGSGLPLMPWYGIEDAYLRQTRQELGALRNELEKEEAGANTLVRKAWFRLDLANREEALYRKSILKLSRDVLDVSTQGYEAGNVSFSDVISSYSSWLDVNLAAERETSAMGIAWADLENAVGAPLHQGRKEERK